MNSAQLHPVYGFADGFPFTRETIAIFFDGWDATDFALHPERHGFEKRECYLAPSTDDLRAAGYRYARLTDAIEEKPLKDGWNRWAA